MGVNIYCRRMRYIYMVDLMSFSSMFSIIWNEKIVSFWEQWTPFIHTNLNIIFLYNFTLFTLTLPYIKLQKSKNIKVRIRLAPSNIGYTPPQQRIILGLFHQI